MLGLSNIINLWKTMFVSCLTVSLKVVQHFRNKKFNLLKTKYSFFSCMEKMTSIISNTLPINFKHIFFCFIGLF